LALVVGARQCNHDVRLAAQAAPRPARTYASTSTASVNENFSLIVMIVFLVLSLAFLAQQITLYH
jgi:hypothetical protein